jgi:hypothetical protein
MAGRPRTTQLPALPRISIPDPPDWFSPAEKDTWRRLAVEVNLAGTYDAACHSAFVSLVRTVAAEEALDLSASSVDTAATRIIGLANTARGYFGLNPAARKKVPGSPLPAAADLDAEFGDRPQLRAVPAPASPAAKPWEKGAK